MRYATALWLRMMGFYLCVIAAASLLFALSGCATMGQHSAAVDLVVSQATMRYIEQAPPAERAARAQRVHDTAERAKAVAQTQLVTVAELAQFAVNYIPSNLTPADRMLALSIIQVAAQEIQAKVGEGKIPDPARLSVVALLDTIENSAAVYAAGS